MWKIKFLWNFIMALVSIVRQYDERLWLRYRKNGNNNRWRMEGKKYDLAFRREKAGAPMTKAQAQQWEVHQAFQSKDEELDDSLVLCAVSLVTWIALNRMNDDIESGKEHTVEEDQTGIE
jgi:hypothetical protein